MNKHNQTKIKFGDTIDFTEVFYDVVYIKEFEKEGNHTKFYLGEQDFTIAEPKPGLGPFDREILPAAFRKVIFKRQEGSGIVIGQTKKYEGIYHPQYYDARELYGEPAYLEPKWTYTFWVVAVGINKTVLVPK